MEEGKGANNLSSEERRSEKSIAISALIVIIGEKKE